jgi:hypothetical protein
VPLELQPAEPAALISAVMAPSLDLLAEATRRLASGFGPVARASEVYRFDFSPHYSAEMGPDLVKQLVCFVARVDPAELSAAKRRTMDVEREMADEAAGRPHRRANIDPGLVTVESLVLATTKYSGQRICIAPGLYAEVTLLFRRGGWTCLEWTYPDYRTPAVQRFLLEVRAELMEARRARRLSPGGSSPPAPDRPRSG